MKNKMKVLDLFCGAGGLSLGFEMTGEFEISAAVDNWPVACDTFKKNHSSLNKKQIITYDLSLLGNKNEKIDFFKNILPVEPGEIDVVLGGPPCQGMSLAGKRLSNDPRNQLFSSFVEIVNHVKPKIFVMENVVGLITANEGQIKEAIIQSFKDIGYQFKTGHVPTILKAEQYGVPQFRRRVFFIGYSQDTNMDCFDWPPPELYAAYENNNENSPQMNFLDKTDFLPSPITVHEAISDLPMIKSGQGSNEMEYVPIQDNLLSDFQMYVRNWEFCKDINVQKKVYNHEAPNHTDKLLKMIKKAAPGQSVDPKYSDSKKWNPKQPSFTIKALGAGGGSTNRRPFHYNQETPRGATVRECARIQSFPDWYIFLGPKTDQMSQVGNAVPPLLAKSIAESIFGGFKNEIRLSSKQE